MGLAEGSWGDWPVAAWVLLLAAVFFVGEYGVLLARQWASRPQGRRAELELERFAAALRRHADGNGQALPQTLDELGLPGACGLAYRPVPRITLDARLILLHGAAPTHKVISFPVLREGRGVVFCSGRLRIVTEDQWEKLVAADDALRERLGLEPMDE